ncbi:MAG: VOC family protein [Planctomycetales bacterium]|nr:VOC family protein [Planctomycetales bacterium]
MSKPKLRHVAIKTDDVHKEAAFWRESFDLEEVGGHGDVAIYLSDGTINLAIIRIDDPDFPNYNELNGLNHIGFVVDSIDSQVAKCSDRGAVSTVDPKHRDAGPTWEMKMRSPSGIDIDLSDHGWPGITL